MRVEEGRVGGERGIVRGEVRGDGGKEEEITRITNVHTVTHAHTHAHAHTHTHLA